MGVVYQPGQDLGTDNLKIFFKDQNNVALTTLTVRYSIYYYNPTSKDYEVLSSQYQKTATVGPAAGQHYADWTIPKAQPVGTYQIRWDYRKDANDLWKQTKMPFAIVKYKTGTSRTAVVSDLSGTPTVIVL